MKKILFVVLTIIFTLGVAVFPCFATEAAEENTENIAEPSINATQDDEARFMDEVIGAVTSVENWGKIGVYFLGVVALIAAIYKKLSPLFPFLAKMKDEGATKDDIKKSFENNKEQIISELKSYIDEVLIKLSDVKSEEDTTLTILTILANAMKINPTAKTEIANYLTGICKPEGTVEEVVKAVGEKIQAAMAQEEKIDTPALDEILKENPEATEAHITLG